MDERPPLTIVSDSDSIVPDSEPRPEPPPTSNWYRQLRGDRIEVCLQTAGLRLRASGHETLIWHLIGEFEKLTGAEAVGEWKRPLPKGPHQLDGQISIINFSLEDDDA